MDTTQTDDLLRELEEAQPEDAPDPADHLAAVLAAEVDEARDEGGAG